MTTAPVKPWSPIDDDAEADADRASPASSPSHPTKRAAVEPKTPGPQPGSAAQPWSAHLTTWALVPLGLAFCIHVWDALASFPGPSTGIVAGLSVAVGIAATAVLMVLGHHARRAASKRLASDILSSSTHGTGAIPPTQIPDDIRPVWNAVHEHLDSVDSRLAELKEQQRDLAMERSLSEVQKRNTIAIIDSISDAVLVTDAFDRIVLANPAAAAIFGFDRAESLRRPVTDVVSDDSFLRALRQVRDSSGAAIKRHVEHAIGERTYALTLSQVSAQRVDDDPGAEARGVVAVMRDITKDQKVSRLKSEFVSQVSHELRTPLSSIRAYAELLVDGEAADEETRREYYDIIQTAAQRLARLIDNMLNISRIESGTVRINKEPVAASMVVRDALDVMRPQAEDKRIRLTDELTPVMYRVYADRDLLYQAVLNLISNAVKYTPEGGDVHVRVTPHEEKQTITIAVRDTGVGIPEEALPHMFEKFFRVETSKKMAKGTGLGLNLVKHIAETVHGGAVRLTSKVGEGSTFEMELPLLA